MCTVLDVQAIKFLKITVILKYSITIKKNIKIYVYFCIIFYLLRYTRV